MSEFRTLKEQTGEMRSVVVAAAAGATNGIATVAIPIGAGPAATLGVRRHGRAGSAQNRRRGCTGAEAERAEDRTTVHALG